MSSRTALFGGVPLRPTHVRTCTPLLFSRYSSTTSSTRILEGVLRWYSRAPNLPSGKEDLSNMDNYQTDRQIIRFRFDSNGQSFLTFGKFAIKNVNRIGFPPPAFEESIFPCFFVASSTNWYSFHPQEDIIGFRKWACSKTRSRFLILTLEFYGPLVNAAAPHYFSSSVSSLRHRFVHITFLVKARNFIVGSLVT